MPKVNQHVVPYEGKWAVKAQGSTKPTSVHETQEEAINQARKLAHRLGTVLVIHEQHGRVEHQESFAKKEVAPKKAKANQHVMPHEGKWAVKAEGSDKPTTVHETQQEATKRAREIAKEQGTVLFIHAHDGHVREQHNYGTE